MPAEGEVRAVLAEAAAVAGAAPSIHNTQPWLWRLDGAGLELYAQRDRQLAASDPDGRMLTVSCGAALHHARVALAGSGWNSVVQRFPDDRDGNLLARLTISDRVPVTAEATRQVQAIRLRHTDRRPVVERSVAPAVLDLLVDAAREQGARLQLLYGDPLDDLAVAVAQAATVNAGDPAIQAELQRWTGGHRRQRTGVPDEAIPEQPPQTSVAGRVFARSGTLPVNTEHDKAAVYALLYGDTDEPADWLRGGEALSAVWLTAVQQGVGLLPISEAVEMPASRQTLRRALSFMGWPYLAVRLGIADVAYPESARTPRLPTAAIVDNTDRPEP